MKKRYILLWMVLCIAAAVMLICAIAFYHTSSKNQQDDVENLRDQLKKYRMLIETEAPSEELPSGAETEDVVIQAAEETTTEETDPPESESESQAEESEIPAEKEDTESSQSESVIAEIELEATLDFQTMWETNSDICAWIEIDGTKVDYPVLQSAEDDSKYLSTAVDGSYYIGGSIFTQASYNSRDFNDPVTIIYGHTMKSGTLFGQLQQIYSSASEFEEHSEIKLYLPDEVRYYTVFAAVPYENIHILHAYDFSNDYWYKNFFGGVEEIRSFGANFNSDITPEPGDRVIILSTCLNEDSTKRFLVMAILQDDIA